MGDSLDGLEMVSSDAVFALRSNSSVGGMNASSFEGRKFSMMVVASAEETAHQ